MKKLFIRIALKMLAKHERLHPNMGYGEYAEFGILDVIKNTKTGEKMFILDS